MNSISFFCITILFVTAGSISIKEEFPDLIHNPYEDFNCTKPGYQCDGCDKSYYCIPVNDEFIPQLIEDCEANEKTCLESTGQCTEGENPECIEDKIDYELTCLTLGMFPHPFHCDEYFICHETKKAVVQHCPEGFHYDKSSTMCNKKATACVPLLKPCQGGPVEIGPVPGHSSMYYICLAQEDDSVTPQLALCPRNEVFVNSTCIAPSTGLDDAGKCLSTGLFYNPDDCKMYSECTAQGLSPNSRVCACGSKFHPETRACDVMTC